MSELQHRCAYRCMRPVCPVCWPGHHGFSDLVKCELVFCDHILFVVRRFACQAERGSGEVRGRKGTSSPIRHVVWRGG